MTSHITHLQQTAPATKPVKHQTEQMTRIKGIALAILGAALIAGFITGMVLMPPALPFGIVFGASFTTLLGAMISTIAAIHLLNKPCWEDPAYVAKLSKKAQGMTLQQIEKTFGWEKVKKHQILTQDQLMQKVNKEIDEKGMYTFIEKSGKSLHTIFKDDPRFKERLALEIKDKSVADIMSYGWLEEEHPYDRQPFMVSVHKPLILNYKELLKVEMTRQLQEMGPKAFYEKHKEGFYRLFEHKVMVPEAFTEMFKMETEGKSIKEMVDTYGWKLFQTRILDFNDYRSQFEEAMKERMTLEGYIKALTHSWSK